MSSLINFESTPAQALGVTSLYEFILYDNIKENLDHYNFIDYSKSFVTVFYFSSYHIRLHTKNYYISLI